MHRTACALLSACTGGRARSATCARLIDQLRSPCGTHRALRCTDRRCAAHRGAGMTVSHSPAGAVWGAAGTRICSVYIFAVTTACARHDEQLVLGGAGCERDHGATAALPSQTRIGGNSTCVPPPEEPLLSVAPGPPAVL